MTNDSLLCWRPNLRATHTVDADGPCVHIEDPVTGKFFRVGSDEFALLSRLDGKRSWREIADDVNHTLESRAFSDHDVQSILEWARQRRLLVSAREARVETDHSSTTAHAPSSVRWSLLSIRIPFGSPDRFCTRALPWLTWLFGKPAFIAWCLLLVLAAVEVAVEWERFVTSSESILVPTNWLRLGIAWVVLKVIHEAAHALVCKRHGGEIREAGIALIYFAPVAYVDVTSCWRFASRWPRIHTALAGMYAELACAALALLLAGQSGSPEQQHFLDNVALMASATTLLFNLNPLSRFDGYYVLADLLGLTNLYARSRQAAAQFFRRLLTGSRSETPISLPLALYGAATWLWSAVVTVGIISAAALYWHGLGLILAAVIVWTWLVPLFRRLAKSAQQSTPAERVRLTRRIVFASGLTAVALCLMPWPFSPSAPGVVEFSPLAVVRAESGGFVDTVLVDDGTSVVQGQPLLELRNDELAREHSDLEIAIEQSRLRERLAIEQQDVAAAQIERQQREAFQRRLHERQQQVDRLILRAPISGVVLSRKLSLLPGSFVTEGSEVLSIGDPARCEFVAAVPQDEASSIPQHADQPVVVHLHGRGKVFGRVQRAYPRASIIPDQLCLCAPFGGPLAVRLEGEETEVSQHTSPTYALLKPHMRLTVILSSPDHGSLSAGERGWVSWTRPRTVAEALWDGARRHL